MATVVTKNVLFQCITFSIFCSKKKSFQKNWKSFVQRLAIIIINKWYKFGMDRINSFLVIVSTAKLFFKKHDSEIIAFKDSSILLLHLKLIYYLPVTSNLMLRSLWNLVRIFLRYCTLRICNKFFFDFSDHPNCI